jgi:hypothetical protein
MRTLCVTAALIVGFVPIASAQTASRFEVAPVVRADRVALKGRLHTIMPVFGAVVSARLWKTWGVEGEISKAQGREFGSSYEGILQSFAPSGATRDEYNRLGVLYRVSEGYIPGIGGSLAAIARCGCKGRADVEFRLGLALRNYGETFDYTVLRIPSGIDPARVGGIGRSDGTGPALTHGRVNTVRGGFLIGMDVPVKITKRVTVTPDLRYVYSGPEKQEDGHREASFGIRAGWRF